VVDMCFCCLLEFIGGEDVPRNILSLEDLVLWIVKFIVGEVSFI